MVRWNNPKAGVEPKTRMPMNLILSPDDPMKSALEMVKRNLKCERTGTSNTAPSSATILVSEGRVLSVPVR